MILPFGLLLASIALGPLLFSKWWSKNYPKVALVLGAITLAYYLFGFQGELPKGHGISFYKEIWRWFWTPSAAHHKIFETLHEYISFIALIGSLFVVSGGIHINVKGEARPITNVVFLLVGAILANFLGTTGASMLLIRPWLRMNKYRVTAHHVLFFIFIVSNVGGCLTPIGDPPLFLGYLKGIPFWWVAEHCWPMWAVGIGILLAMFYVVDAHNFRRAPKQIRAEATQHEEWRFDGIPNVLLLTVIIAAVFIKNPPFLREGLMIGAAVASYFTTKKSVHEANNFNFHPIQEVAILFIGIFATMMPALDWLQVNSRMLGTPSPSLYYWACGSLSGFLDNAPTYLSFLSAIEGTIDHHLIAQVQQLVGSHGAELTTLTGPDAEQIRATFSALNQYFSSELAAGKITIENIEIAFLLGNRSFNNFIVAISVGSVFFGAATYIGNGPNFMVKAIADHQKIHTPGFMSYVLKYTLPFLVPVLFIIWLIFFRN